MSKIKAYHSDAIDSFLKEIDPEVEKRIEFRMQLAAKIDKARIKMNLSKKQFAAKLSKSPSEISKWLSGTHNFTSDTLFEIQQLLKVELINVEDRPKEEIWHFSVQVAQEELRSTITPGFTRQNTFSDLFFKSTTSKLSMPEFFNYKIVAEA
jgi:transcriptional regulator with XRE-family HTH domain